MVASAYVDTDNRHVFAKGYLDQDERLIRLFSVACCYLVWNRFDDRARNAVICGELFADGLVTELDRQKEEDFINSYQDHFQNDKFYFSIFAARYAIIRHPTFSLLSCDVANYLYSDRGRSRVDNYIMMSRQGFALQNMKGNWDNSWKTKDVTDLATIIYDNKQYELMPILADALIEAGCEDEQILNYCQKPNFYFRGCWVLDKATGKR